MKRTQAMVRAMVAVRAGKVMQIYTARGNTFEAPKGIGQATLRKLEGARWIEDVPGQAHGVASTRLKLQLSKAGRAALEP